MRKPISFKVGATEFKPKDPNDSNYYFDHLVVPLVKDVFNTSLFRHNKDYGFIDVYFGQIILITPDEYTLLNNANPTLVKEFMKICNEEHVIPASIYRRKEPIVNDLHNVLPALTFINDVRSNLLISVLPDDIKPTSQICFDTTKQIATYSTPDEFTPNNCVKLDTSNPLDTYYGKTSKKLKSVDFSTTSCNFGDCKFEPAQTEYRGLIARTVLYFDWKYAGGNYGISPTIYPLNQKEFDARQFVNKKLYMQLITPAIRDLMITWDYTHPPTWYECQRHSRIVAKTGIRNPFTELALQRGRINPETCIPDPIYQQGYGSGDKKECTIM
jgi:endonuclease I